jgi:hypothetical protein
MQDSGVGRVARRLTHVIARSVCDDPFSLGSRELRGAAVRRSALARRRKQSRLYPERYSFIASLALAMTGEYKPRVISANSHIGEPV